MTASLSFGSEHCPIILVSNYQKDWTFEIPHYFPPEDQCSLSVCHAYAWAQYLNVWAKQRGVEVPQIDADAVAYMRWRSQAYKEMRAEHVKDPDFDLRAFFHESLYGILQSGLYPKGIVELKPGFRTRSFSQKINRMLKEVIRSYRNLFNNASDDLEVMDELLVSGRQSINDVFKEQIGDLPREFQYGDKKYTPKEYARAHYAILNMAKMLTVWHVNPMYQGTKYYEQMRDPKYTIYSGSDLVVANVITQLIRAGFGVYVNFEFHRAHYNQGTGELLSHRVSKGPEVPPSRMKRIQLGMLKRSMHDALITGIDIDLSTGQLRRLKVKNSWGAEGDMDASQGMSGGHKEFLTMDAGYFREFVHHIVFTRDLPIRMPR
jgi:hypothetical protein